MKGNMGLIVRTELYKICKRKDTWLFFAVLLVPALYAIGLSVGSDIITYSGDGNITAMNFAVTMFQMSQSMFIFGAILAIIAARTLGTEIEDKSLLLYLNRVGDRRRIYRGKLYALTVYNLVADILLMGSSFLFYYFVLIRRKDIAAGILWDANGVLEFVQICAVCLFWIMTILIMVMLSTKFKPVVCLGIYMIGYVIMNLLSYARVIGYVSPLFYLGKFTNADTLVIKEIIIYILYFVIISLGINYLGKRRMEKKDL
ncbi:MAG TPA: hypothetical protein H9780_10905 [Candidatus Mediterraneibacter merdavium]|nr:hypothetical protein [Candidatus Mediterraneibacter merdavium]